MRVRLESYERHVDAQRAERNIIRRRLQRGYKAR